MALVQVIGLIRRHHCLRHRPFHHRLIGCIDIGARGHMPWYHSKCYFRYIYAPFQKEVRDSTSAETLDDPYYRRVPLPRIQGYRKLDKEALLANAVHIPHWYTTLQRNSILVMRNIARETTYDRLRRMHNPYRRQ